MTTIQLAHNGEVESHENIADTLHVGNTLRYATMTGEPHEIEDGEIRKGFSDTPLLVTIKNHATSNKEKFYDIRFVKNDIEDGVVYISGRNTIDRIVGEIVRIRRMFLE